MSKKRAKWLIINMIWVEDKEITVGATDNERWEWEKEDNYSGADAKTSVWVTLTDNGPRRVVSETVGLFCSRGDPLRNLLFTGIQELLDVAWEIKESNLSLVAARERFFGYRLSQ